MSERGFTLNERGFTLIELLVATAVGAIVLLGIGGFYVATVRFAEQSHSQTFLQRQGTMIIDEVARQVQWANGLTQNPSAPNNCPADPSLRVVQPGVVGSYCFYSSDDALYEQRPDGNILNLVSGSPVPLTVHDVTFILDPGQKRVILSFELRDDQSNSMMFTVDLTARN